MPAKGGASISDHIEMVLGDIRDGMKELREDVKKLVRPVERHGVKIDALIDGHAALKKELYGNGDDGLVGEIQALRNSLDMHLRTKVVAANARKPIDWERVGKWVVATMAALGYLVGVN